MIKLFLLLLSLAIGGVSGFLFYTLANNDIFLTILVSIGCFVGAILVFVILFFVILFFATFFESKKKTRLYQSKYFRFVLLLCDKFLFSLFNMKLHLNGINMLTKSETYLLVGNHRSNLDSIIIDYYLKDFPLAFIGKESLFKIPFVGKIIHGCAYLKLNRDDVNEEFKTISDAITMMNRTDNPISIGVFPEGTRNKSNDPKNVQAFKPGTFRIAKKTKKPIVITALRGTKEINNNLLFKKHDCYLDIIEVLEFDQYKDMDVNEIALYCENKIKDFLKETVKWDT